MLLIVVDANGNQQTIVAQNQGAAQDYSGTIGPASGDDDQVVAPANANRAGCYFQNHGAHNMTVSELGDASAALGPFLVPPGQAWPPAGYPVPASAVRVAGTLGEVFLYREWSTLPPDDTV